MNRLLIIISLSAMLLTGVVSSFANTINWYQPDFPPYVIITGPDKEHGIDNQIVQHMVKHLPEHNHVLKVANYKRILSDLSNGKNGIITPLFKIAEREEFVHYSEQPSYLVFSNGFIYRKADREKYTPFILKDGTLDLEALCQSDQFTIGINSGRSYYGIIDKTIQQYSNNDMLLIRSATNQIGLLKMVRSQKVDAVFGFPVEIKYANLGQKLDFFIISKMDPLTPVYFGAPKNTFGIQTIDMLNNIIKEKDLLDQFKENYMFWLDTTNKKKYERLYQQYYLQR